MPKVRFDPDKWASRAGGAGTEYAEGVQNPRRSQSASAIAAADVWASQIQTAISNGSYAKGLSEAGDAKWQRGVREKGRTRYQSGVMAGKDAYRSGFQPYASALESLDLGPRGPKGQNYDRVQRVGELLREVKSRM